MNFKKYIFLLIIPLLFSSCTNNTAVVSNKLELINTYLLDISEPSGLTFDSENKNLIIISDGEGKFFITDLSGNKISSEKLIDGDYEGVTLINGINYAAVIERTRQILIFNENGYIINNIETGITGIENNGFEGIAFLTSENAFVVANEKNPVALYKISFDGVVLSSTEFSSAKDISGVCYNSEKEQFWILSEESNSMFRCDLNFKIIETFNLPDDKLEGIAINNDDVFLVSDKSNLLYHYKMKN